LLFARKPAPVQVAWLAYPGTTGQTAIDFRLTDPWLDPADFDDALCGAIHPLAQHILVLRPGCRDSGGQCAAGARGGIRDVWLPEQFLQGIGSVIALVGPYHGERRARVSFCSRRRGRIVRACWKYCAEFAIAPERIEFVPYQPRHAYLKTYQRIDLCLDTLPYNGHTTSLDAYWMGVPVVTRVGATVVGRAGWSQLNNLKLPQLAAFDDASFVHKAVELATVTWRRWQTASRLRERMLASPLMDAASFRRGDGIDLSTSLGMT
jgi:protein O-GlcNAc transferase